MRKLVLIAALVTAISGALFGQTADDSTVVVGNPAQPVQWLHKGSIKEAIQRAGPTGTVWIPSNYLGTDCNPIATCNPSGLTTVIDLRSGTFGSTNINLSSPPAIGNVAPNSGAFTTLSGTFPCCGANGNTPSFYLGSTVTNPAGAVSPFSCWFLTVSLNNQPHIVCFDGNSYLALVTNNDTPGNLANGTIGNGQTVLQQNASLINPNIGDALGTSLTLANFGGNFPVAETFAKGTAAMTTAGIGSGACGTTVTVATTGILTTDAIIFARNAAATIGNGGGLTLNAWPTAGNVNLNYCNSSAGTITPTSMGVNWRVLRDGAPAGGVTTTLTITATGTGTGSVSSSDGQIASCSSGGGACTGTYNIGASVTLTPTATGGSGFFWSSGTDGASICSGAGPCTFVITSTATLQAVFTGSGGGSVPASPTFSLDLNSNTQYPTTISHGQIRFWDTPGAQWSFIETANNVFSFTSLDTVLQSAAANSVHTAQFGLARTPNWASSNTDLTVAGTLISGAFTNGETAIQGTTGVSVTVRSGTASLLTISQYTSGTADATHNWVGQTSGAVFSPTQGSLSFLPAGCSYFTNGSTNKGQLSGQCAAPIDVNADGSGTDLIWRNWVAAIVTHANQSGYIAGTGTWAAGGANCPGVVACSHAHIAYWEIWNEPYATGKFWIGSYDQLIRFAQDADCIINSTAGAGAVRTTGESCSQVRATVTSVSSCCDGANGVGDSTAQIVMPSYAPAGANLAQCFLYCTPNVANQCGSPATSCTAGGGGHASIDRINFHAKPGANLETAIPTQVAAMEAILQSAELAKPLDNTEAGFSATGWSGAYTDGDMQAAYIARMYIFYYWKGVANDVWYNWSPANAGLGSSQAAVAYTQVYNWMVGSTVGNCTNASTVWTCTMTLPSGTAAAMIWDTSKSCAAGICTTANQTVATHYQSYLDLAGDPKTSISSHIVPVGIKPILLQDTP